MVDEDRWETGEHKSLEEHILENIDQAAKSAEVPAKQSLQTANFMKNVVIFLAFYTALVAFACTYAIWEVQKQNERQQRYLLEQCYQGNESRAAEREVIDTILGEDLALAELEGYVPSQAELDAFARIEASADEAWPQRDCGKVDEGRIVEISTDPPSLPKG